MKTRTDFVSNSSSCSFVIAIGKSFPLNDFIKEACDGCLKHADDDDDALFRTKLNEFNNAVLNYHLRASELLYLGGLKTKIESDDVIYGMAIPNHYVSYVTMEYHWHDDYKCDIKMQKKAAKAIAEFAKNYSDSKTDYKCRYDSATYFISRTTIWNTRALIAAGYEVELEEWMDLDKLDKMLQDGDKLFNIHVNNGGDGMVEDALYTFGGWDGEDIFENMDGVEVLDGETM